MFLLIEGVERSCLSLKAVTPTFFSVILLVLFTVTVSKVTGSSKYVTMTLGSMACCLDRHFMEAASASLHLSVFAVVQPAVLQQACVNISHLLIESSLQH